MSASPETYRNLMRDFCFELSHLALEAKTVQRASNSEFDDGYLAGFHRVVSLLQQQAEAFGLTQADVFLAELDPDRDLV